MSYSKIQAAKTVSLFIFSQKNEIKILVKISSSNESA